MDENLSFALDLLAWTTWELQMHLLLAFSKWQGHLLLTTTNDGKEEFGIKAKVS